MIQSFPKNRRGKTPQFLRLDAGGGDGEAQGGGEEMVEGLDDGHQFVMPGRGGFHQVRPVFLQDIPKPGQPGVSPCWADGDVLAGQGGDAGAEEGMEADDLRGGGGQHGPHRPFLERGQVHEQGLRGQAGADLLDDRFRDGDRDADDNHRTGRRQGRKIGAPGPAGCHHRIAVPPEEVCEPLAHAPGAADDPEGKYPRLHASSSEFIPAA